MRGACYRILSVCLFDERFMFRNALLALGLAGCGLGCAAGLPNSSEEAVMPPPLQWSDVARRLWSACRVGTGVTATSVEGRIR